MDYGNITFDHTKINDTFRNFYSHLYTSELPDENILTEIFFDCLNIPIVPPDNKNKLDEPISTEEIVAAISSLQLGKSPGPDRFPDEFFKAFSSLLAPKLYSALSD